MNTHFHIEIDDAGTAADEMELEHLTRDATAADDQDYIDNTGSDYNATALHRAVKEKNIEALKDLLEVANIDLNYKTEVDGYTALMLAIEEIRNVYTEEPDAIYYSNVMANVDRQVKILEEMIKLLLLAGCDVNTRDWRGITPIYSAAEQGLYTVVDMIRSFAKKCLQENIVTQRGDTLLHATVRGMGSRIKYPKADFDSCLNLFLTYTKMNVNQLDNNNNTALHYAAYNGDDDTVLKLLRHGACVGIMNKDNESPLVNINAKTLETYLDECITTNYVSGYRPTDECYEIRIKYVFLANINTSIEDGQCNDGERELNASLAPETNALLYMTQNKELRPLLKHPVITSFLYLKWQRISCLAYVNITFYSLLCLCLILYIIWGYGVEKKQSDSVEVLNIVTYVGVIIGLILLIFRELFQLLLSPVRYVMGIENLMEIALIFITAWMVFYDSAQVSIKQQLSAVAILISSAELLLLIGQFPVSSTNILMLKTVSWNFLKFLLWYCILIIAFALSFYTLFRQVENDQTPPPQNLNSTEKEESETLFSDPFRALFKTIVMLTGEFDAGSIQFNKFPVTSHIIFIVFVFMIPIVLFNLLNGLAVSDTQKIRADAELVGLISRVRLISYFESIIMGNGKAYRPPTKCWTWLITYLPDWKTRIINLKAILIKPFAKRICLFPHFLYLFRIYVIPNQNNKILIPFEISGHDSRCVSFKGKLDGTIVKNAMIVISKKKNVTEFDGIKATLIKNEANIRRLEAKIERLATTNKNLETKIGSFETTNKSLETKIESLETTNKSLDTKIGSLETTNKSLETKIGSLETTNKSLETKIGSLETTNKSLETKIGSFETTNKSLEIKIGNIETTNKSLDTKIDSIETTTKSLDTKIYSIETTNKSLDTKIDSIETTNKSLECKFGNLETKIENLETTLHMMLQTLERMSMSSPTN